ncbi:helix-turn-helix transcriptional regulator [Algivirga pacifica]|uniref:HTH cro/C1-type domain-containing protein n=1 Tax=Algivirga pacifica TaxID=1162670 RepID=A0ABP9D2V0_9BACT
MHNIYKIIQEVREEKKLQKSQVADAIEMHRSAYGKMESTGKPQLTIERLEEIAEVLNTSSAELLVRSGSPVKSKPQADTPENYDLLERKYDRIRATFIALTFNKFGRQIIEGLIQNNLQETPDTVEEALAQKAIELNQMFINQSEDLFDWLYEINQHLEDDLAMVNRHFFTLDKVIELFLKANIQVEVFSKMARTQTQAGFDSTILDISISRKERVLAKRSYLINKGGGDVLLLLQQANQLTHKLPFKR